MKGLIDEKYFNEKDWIDAVSFVKQLNRSEETISVSQKGLQQFPGSSYLHYLLGKSLLVAKKPIEAKLQFQKAIELDSSNDEAASMLQ